MHQSSKIAVLLNGHLYPIVKNLEHIKHGLESWRGYWDTIPPFLVFAIDVWEFDVPIQWFLDLEAYKGYLFYVMITEQENNWYFMFKAKSLPHKYKTNYYAEVIFYSYWCLKAKEQWLR